MLIVEDDPDLRELLALLLTDAGFETEVANNGQDALHRALDNPPRVIVLDMMMPVMDGWAFRAHQRCCVTLATIPVIILSGADAHRFSELDAVAAFEKPVAMAQIASLLRRLLTSH